MLGMLKMHYPGFTTSMASEPDEGDMRTRFLDGQGREQGTVSFASLDRLRWVVNIGTVNMLGDPATPEVVRNSAETFSLIPGGLI